jgi:hypothetical protein
MIYNHGRIQGHVLPMEEECSRRNACSTSWESWNQEIACTYSTSNGNLAIDAGVVSWSHASQDEDSRERREGCIKMSSIVLAEEGYFDGTEHIDIQLGLK